MATARLLPQTATSLFAFTWTHGMHERASSSNMTPVPAPNVISAIYPQVLLQQAGCIVCPLRSSQNLRFRYRLCRLKAYSRLSLLVVQVLAQVTGSREVALMLHAPDAVGKIQGAASIGDHIAFVADL